MSIKKKIFLCILFLVQNKVTLAQTEKENKYLITQIEDIKRWKDLPGGKYVVGYIELKETKELIPAAIYDKTFISPHSLQFWLRLLAATIGVNDLNVANAAKKMKKKEKKKGIKLDPDWWKNPNIKWKNHNNTCPYEHAPERVSLSKIIYLPKSESKTRKSNRKLNKYLKLNQISKEIPFLKEDNIFIKKSFLNKDSDGYYTLKFYSRKKEKPVKVIDLLAYDSSLHFAMNWAISTNLLKAALSFIPIFGMTQLVIATLERSFNYIETLYLMRHAATLELILQAISGQKSSPFYNKLNKDELLHSVGYLLRSNTMLSGIIRSKLNKKKLIEKFFSKREKNYSKSIYYLNSKGITINSLEKTSFALGIKNYSKNNKKENKGKKKFKIYSLTKLKGLRKKPYTLVDYLNENKEIRKRNALEAGLIGTSLIPVPGLQPIIKISYKEGVIRKIHKYQMQEESLKATILNDPSIFKKAFIQQGFSELEVEDYLERTLQQIERRKMNPLDLSREEEHKNIKKVERWIKKQDPDYRPWEM